MMQQKKKDSALVMRLAWPCILENLSATAVSLVDTAMVGSLGAVATAAVGVCASPTWLAGGIVQALGVGGTALVARAIGANEKDGAEHIARQVLRIAILLALALSAVLFFGAPLIPLIMQAKPEVVPDATKYIRILSYCYPIYYTGLCMSAILRGAGDTKTPMKCGLIANLLNIILNFLLIYETRTISVFGVQFVMWGAGLGVCGAAIASAIGMGLSGVYLLAHMAGRKSAVKLRVSLKERWDREVVARVLKIGTPAALERAAINIGQMVFAAMISGIGTVEIAAYHISINVEALGYMPANGFAAAATALVGQNLGAKQAKEAEQLGKRSIVMSLILLTLIGVAMYFSGGFLASLFSPDAAVVSMAAAFITIVAAEQPFNAFCIVTAGALHGAGDTITPFVYGLITMWGVRIFGAWLFGVYLGLGVFAIYWAMVADLGLRSILLFTRFLHGKWKEKRI